MAFVAKNTEQKETILIWNINKDRHDTMRLILVMAGYDVRQVYDESDAINITGIMNQTNQMTACLLIKCNKSIEKLSSAFANLAESQFAAPILLVLPSEDQAQVVAIRSKVPQMLDVRFCLSDNTLDALTGIVV